MLSNGFRRSVHTHTHTQFESTKRKKSTIDTNDNKNQHEKQEIHQTGLIKTIFILFCGFCVCRNIAHTRTYHTSYTIFFIVSLVLCAMFLCKSMVSYLCRFSINRSFPIISTDFIRSLDRRNSVSRTKSASVHEPHLTQQQTAAETMGEFIEENVLTLYLFKYLFFKFK